MRFRLSLVAVLLVGLTVPALADRRSEAKDLVGGFTLVEARDIDEAVQLSHGCPILEGGGSVEVRPIMKMDV